MRRPHRRCATALWPLAALAVLASACARLEDGAFDAALEAERLRSGVELQVLELPSGPTEVLVRDGEGPAVVLVHGFNAEKDIWLAFVRELPDHWRVVVPDLPGHGGTAAPPADTALTGDWLARRLAEVVETLELDRHHLAGNSLGGLVAARYALAHPGRVQSLGLFNPAGVVSPERSDMERMVLAGDNPLIVRSGRDFDRLLDLVYVEQPVVPWPGRPALVRRMAARAPFLERLWDALWVEREDMRPLLGELRVPALVLWGREDRVLHVSAADVWASGICGARLEVLDGIGHSPMSEDPARSARLWLEFADDAEHATGD